MVVHDVDAESMMDSFFQMCIFSSKYYTASRRNVYRIWILLESKFLRSAKTPKYEIFEKIIFRGLLPICWWWEGCHLKDQDEISSKTTFSSPADDYRPSKFQFNIGQKNMFFYWFFNIFEINVFAHFSTFFTKKSSK